jgi:hemerythrin-like domain-containing protein
MLTLTYALVALSVEQKKVQGRLSELQQCIEKLRSATTVIGHSEAESLLAEFLRLDDNCHSRNIELYVLPAIRSLSPQADNLLAEVDQIAATGRIVLKKARNILRKAAMQDEFDEIDFFDSLETYCLNLTRRFTTEEMHLLPLAQRLISSDEWFDIAAKFISHESERHPRRNFEGELAGILAPAHVAAMHQGGNQFSAAN